MAILTVRILPDEVQRALRVRAASHGRSTEAEVRLILEEAVKPGGQLRMGSLLRDIGQQIRLDDDEMALLNQRYQSSASGKNHMARKAAVCLSPSAKGKD